MEEETHMADPPDDVAADDDDGAGIGPDHGRSGLARWQKVAVIIGLLAVLLIVLTLFVGGGHTPPVQHGMA
jgi:hypothetical protein